MSNPLPNPLEIYLSTFKESLPDLAKRMGRHKATLYRILSGERGTSVELCADVERATNGAVSAAEFFKIALDAVAERRGWEDGHNKDPRR